MRNLKLCLILFFTFFMLSSVSAKMDRKHRMDMMEHPHAWWYNPEVVKELNLTDKQIDEINKIKTTTKKKIIKIGAEMVEKMIDLNTAMTEENLKDSKINKTINEIAKLRGEMFKIRLKAELKGLKVLTTDQRKKLKKLQFVRPRFHKKGRGRKEK